MSGVEGSTRQTFFSIVSHTGDMASYNRAHYVFRILGHFGPNATTAREQWSTGFRLGLIGTDVSLNTDLEPFLETVATPIATFHGSNGALVGSNCWLSELTIARVGLDGKYAPAAQETTRRAYATPTAGIAQPVHSWNSAMVISLRTAFPRGIASNGRTYYPATGIPIDSGTGRVGDAHVTGFVAAAKTMLDAVNTAAGNLLEPLVRVGVFGQDGLTGSARVGWVERIRCDNRLDSIERRENDQPSVWQETALA